ncbi:hypothetical protein [Arthrobacter koreensis]|uniref:hypothetical protein n=1 Tax=Arthrobacter koreensis TaxID=199136 RepID=UPI0037F28365
MRTPKPLPPSFSDPFLAADAQRAGLTRGRLRASDLRIPSRGIRVPRAADGDAGDLAARARPYLQLLPDAVLSHTTAAGRIGDCPSIGGRPSHVSRSDLH